MHAETRYVLDYRETIGACDLICRFLMHFFGKDILPHATSTNLKMPKDIFAICTKPMSEFMEFFYDCAGETSGARFTRHLHHLKKIGQESQDLYPLSLMIPLVFEAVPDSQRLQMAMSLHKRLAVYHPGATDCLLGGMEYIVCGDVHPVEHLVRHILGRYQSLRNMDLPPGLMTMFCAEAGVFLSLQGIEPDWNACLDSLKARRGVEDLELFPLILFISLSRKPGDALSEVKKHFLENRNPALTESEAKLLGLTAVFLSDLEEKSQEGIPAESLMSAFLIWVFSVLFPARLKARL
jgi:hypothetical protein